MAMRMAAAAAGYKEQEDPKALLAREICSISSIFSSCTHRRRSPASARRGFVDWYLILRVDENVGIDAIRRRYRQLALQLHPDKNGHPKAEVAFKLVSEGAIIQTYWSLHLCTSTCQSTKMNSSEGQLFSDGVWMNAVGRLSHVVSDKLALEHSEAVERVPCLHHLSA